MNKPSLNIYFKSSKISRKGDNIVIVVLKTAFLCTLSFSKIFINLGTGWQTKRMDKNFDFWAVKVNF